MVTPHDPLFNYHKEIKKRRIKYDVYLDINKSLFPIKFLYLLEKQKFKAPTRSPPHIHFLLGPLFGQTPFIRSKFL